MMDLFLKLYDQGSTLIMVSHDMDNVIKYATDVTVLSKGEIIKECKPQELFLDDSLVSSLSIEEPKCIKFAKRLNQNGYHIDLGKVVDEKSLALEIVKERKK